MKFYTDFFVYKKKHHWFILPALIFYYDRYEFYDEGKIAPSFGITIRWLIFMAGFQLQFIDQSKPKKEVL